MKLTFPSHKIFTLPLIVSALLPLSATASGSDGPIIDRIDDSTSPATQLGSYTFDANPAAEAYRHPYTLSSINISADYLRQSKPATVQEGDGHMTGAFTAGSYMRLRRNTVVWGAAEFQTGQFRNIRWNNSSDYSRISPYVIGDSVGGDVQSRRYSFNGGYAGTAGRWSWGAKASYRASIDYRNRDPRVKIIVSDLNIDLGGTYKISNLYAIGLSGGVNIYVQESDLKFYNPINTIQTYAMTGIGTTYTRFSGNSTESTAYSGIGYRAAMQLFSIKDTGLKLTVDYNYARIDQILRDFNNLTLCYTDNHRLSGQASYVARLSGSMTIGARLNAMWQRRLGTENLFGTAVNNTYERISSRTYYYNDIVASALEFPIQLHLSRWQIIATPKFGFDYNRESYHRPYRDLECHGYNYGMELEGRWKTQRMLIRAGASCTYSNRTRDKQILTALNRNSSIGAMVVNNYTMLSADRLNIDAMISADYVLDGSIAMFTDVRYNFTDFADACGTAARLVASIGVRF